LHRRRRARRCSPPFSKTCWKPPVRPGNAFEFTQDCASENYQGAPSDGSPWRAGGACENFATRSYFFDSLGAKLRSAARCSVVDWDSRSNGLAIRVAVSLDDSAWDRSN